MFFPPADVDPLVRRGFLLEAHQRLAVPLSVFSFVVIPLACLLPGELNRRGQLRRVLLAVGLAFLFQSLDLGVKNLATRYDAAMPLIYLVDLSPFALGLGTLLLGGIKLDLRRFAPAAG